MSVVAVHGRVADGYEELAEAFATTIVDPDRTGAALSVWHDGQEVVDLRAGTADGRTGRPWTRETPAIAFSASKCLAALAVALLVQDGEVSYDQPVAEIWPEFAAHGKGSVTVGDLLAHRAGLSAPVGPLPREVVLDSRAWAETIAQQEPLWGPGTAHAYHALTLGPLVAEIVRRRTGTELADVVRSRLAAPLGAATTFAPTAADLAAVARIETSDRWDEAARAADDERLARAATLGGVLPRGLVEGDRGFNDPQVQAAGLAAAGAVTTASGLARILSAVVTPTQGVRLLDDATLAALCRPRSSGPWVFATPGPHPTWGAGVQLASDAFPGPSPSSLGHGGAGGQVALADPDRRIGLAYVRNRMDTENPAPALVSALR